MFGHALPQTDLLPRCIGIGALIGFCTNWNQESLYRRAAAGSPTGRAPPEARLYWAAVGGVLFPLGMMIFAWTGSPAVVHWSVPTIMLCISYWGGKWPWAPFIVLILPLYHLPLPLYTSQPSTHHHPRNNSVYSMYCGVFNYFADAYETWSSSAQAAQGMMRNIFAGVFPLFSHQMVSCGGGETMAVRCRGACYADTNAYSTSAWATGKRPL